MVITKAELREQEEAALQNTLNLADKLAREVIHESNVSLATLRMAKEVLSVLSDYDVMMRRRGGS